MSLLRKIQNIYIFSHKMKAHAKFLQGYVNSKIIVLAYLMIPGRVWIATLKKYPK